MFIPTYKSCIYFPLFTESIRKIYYRGINIPQQNTVLKTSEP